MTLAGIWHRDGRPADHARWTDPQVGTSAPGSRWREGPVAMSTGTGALSPTARASVAVAGAIRLRNATSLAERLRTPGDDIGALLRAAYRRYGDGFVSHLQGDFALVLWDGHARKLVLACDALAVRGLYYRCTANTVSWATDLRVLLAMQDHGAAPCPHRIVEFIEGDEFSRPDATFFEGVCRMPGGHQVVVTPSQIRRTRHWSAHAVADRAPIEDPGEVFPQALTDAVASCLGGEKTGVLLSGGIDSVSVLGVAHHVARPPQAIHALSAYATDESRCRERPYVEDAVAFAQVPHHVLRPGDVGAFASDVRRLLETTEDPFDLWLAESRLGLFSAARRQGISLVLDGVDGDLVVGNGWDSVARLVRQGRLVLAARNLRRLSRYYNAPLVSLLRYDVVPHLAPTWSRRLWGRVRRRRDEPPANGLRAPLRTRYAAPTPHAQHVPNPHAALLTSGTLGVALGRYERVATFAGVEVRHPFLDQPLVECCLRTPLRDRVAGGWPKALLRLPQLPVPPSVRWRPYAGTVSPDFWEALTAHLHPWLREIVDGHIDQLTPYMERETLVDWVQSVAHADALWVPATLALLLNRHDTR